MECASSSAPWLEPDVSNNGCGHYGGYIGEAAGFWNVLGCSGFSNAWNATAAGAARDNFNLADGMGTSPYFFGGGPGMDPNYNGTTSEAYNWGVKEAKTAVSFAAGHTFIDDFIMVLDVEDSAKNPAGWNEVMVPGSCTHVQSNGVPTAVDRATFNGFWDQIQNHSIYSIAAYASPGVWSGIFLSDGSLTGTMEWTADFSGCRNPAPTGWTQGTGGGCSSNSANFFGGINSGSDCAMMWQWAGVSLGDFNQIDTPRVGKCK